MVLFSRVEAPDWTADGDPEFEAKCRKLPRPRYKQDPFFDDEDAAMAVCNGWDTDASYENAGQVCPLRHECLAFALINHEGSGIWGGMLLHDRMIMKRNRELPRSEWKWHLPTPKPVKGAQSGEELSVPLAA